jgi:uncharacterized protein (TIGR02996 family)
MSASESLQRAIFDAPLDDAPRLVFADWLEEHGNDKERDQAEFIRTQIALANTPWEEQPGELLFRAATLEHKNGKTWAKATARVTKRYEFRRGFVEKVTVKGATFLEVADRLFASAPLTEVRLLQLKNDFREVFRSPHLARVYALDLAQSQLGVKRLIFLATSPHLDNLRQLNLARSAVRFNGLVNLARAQLPHLTRLDLCRNHLDSRAGETLAAAPFFPHLTFLDLGGNDLTGAGLTGLLKAPAIHLAELRLWETRRGDELVGVLADSPRWGCLRRLDLSSTGLTDAGVERLAGTAHLAGLVELRLVGNAIGDAGLTALAGSPHLRQLRSLNLSGNPLGAAGARRLADSPLLGGLRHLGFGSRSSRSAFPARELLSAPALAGLNWLSLPGERLGQTGARALAEASQLNRLARLHLGGCGLGDAEAVVLAGCPHLASLVELDLSWNNIGDEGARALLRSPYLGRLLRLDLVSAPPRITLAVRQELKDRFEANGGHVGF